MVKFSKISIRGLRPLLLGAKGYIHSFRIPNDVSKRAPNTLSILSLGSLFPIGDVVIASDSNDMSMLLVGGSALSVEKIVEA